MFMKAPNMGTKVVTAAQRIKGRNAVVALDFFPTASG